MKNTVAIIILIIFYTTTANGQFLGVGYQNAFDSKQFVASINVPYNFKGAGDRSFKSGKVFVLYGVDYTSVNKTGFSGLFLKPVQLHYNFNTYGNKSIYCDLALEGSYLINNGLGSNGVVLSPSFYIDSQFLFIKTGYEYHVQDKTSQVFVRIGLGITDGVLGNAKPMKLF